MTEPQRVDERLPGRVLVDPIVHAAVEGLEELAVGVGTDERAVLRAEVGAGDEDRRDPVAHRVVDLRQVLPGRSRTGGGRPRRRSRSGWPCSCTTRPRRGCPWDASATGPGTRAMSPKAVPPKLARIARSLSRRSRSASRGVSIAASSSRDRAELLEVVLDVQLVVVDRLLADDRVEVEPALGHPAARRHRLVALGIHEDVAVGLGHGVEAARAPAPACRRRWSRASSPCSRSRTWSAGRPGRRRRPPGRRAGRARSRRASGRARHFDRRARRVEAQGLAELVDAADVHARDRAWRRGPGEHGPVAGGSGPLRRVGESSWESVDGLGGLRQIDHDTSLLFDSHPAPLVNACAGQLG